MAAFATIISIVTYAGLVYTIPPRQCLANFNWKDCGKSPQTVMYYWKTGSRCEVGIWRGCLPNINMFKDEYECVSTCIFTVRAAEQDWHQINAMEEDITGNMTDYQDKGPVTDNDVTAGDTTVAETTTETGSDTTPETDFETTTETGSETTPETGSETTLETGSEITPGTDSDTTTESVTTNEAGTATESATTIESENTNETPTPE